MAFTLESSCALATTLDTISIQNTSQQRRFCLDQHSSAEVAQVCWPGAIQIAHNEHT